jgi:hypothetical protein
MTTPCPANLMRAIVDVLSDNGLGLEPLAIASIVESPRLTPRITALNYETDRGKHDADDSGRHARISPRPLLQFGCAVYVRIVATIQSGLA